MIFILYVNLLLQWKHTCGCVPSQPCGSCSGCNGPCSSRSESPGSRPSDLAYVCERACSWASRSHSVPSSPLQTMARGSAGHTDTRALKCWTWWAGGQTPTLHDAPGVETASHPLPFGLHHCVAANDCEGNAFLVGGKRGSQSEDKVWERVGG